MNAAQMRRMGPRVRATVIDGLASAMRGLPTADVESRFLMDGRGGANADVNHPRRLWWEAARIILQERGATAGGAR